MLSQRALSCHFPIYIHTYFVLRVLSSPPVEVLKEILLAVKRVTFFGFLIALAKSEGLNASIGEYVMPISSYSYDQFSACKSFVFSFKTDYQVHFYFFLSGKSSI